MGTVKQLTSPGDVQTFLHAIYILGVSVSRGSNNTKNNYTTENRLTYVLDILFKAYRKLTMDASQSVVGSPLG